MAEDQAADQAAEETKQDAAPGEGGEGTEGTAPAGAGKKKLIMLGGAGFAAILIVGVVAWFFLGGRGEAEHATLAGGSVYVEVPPMSMNMLGDGTGEHFLKARVMLEVTSEADKQKVTEMMPKLQDDWNGFLRQMRPEDMQGSAAIQRLKEGLLLRANQALAPVPVKQVLLTELLVQ